MKVLVCGGRDYTDRDTFNRTMDRVHKNMPITLLIHGAARGADTLAKQWADNNNIPQQPFPADWAGLGRKAGPLRNAQMLVDGKPDLVIAFPGNRGTGDMTSRARKARVPVYEVGGAGDRAPLNFATEPERRQWIIDRADYFTTCFRKNRSNNRDEWPTLAKAEKAAQRIVHNHPDRHVLIYAVAGVHDVWVKTVKKG